VFDEPPGSFVLATLHERKRNRGIVAWEWSVEHMASVWRPARRRCPSFATLRRQTMEFAASTVPGSSDFIPARDYAS
jgi:hypothetical protein